MTTQTRDDGSPPLDAGTGAEHSLTRPVETWGGFHDRQPVTVFVDTNVWAWVAENTDPAAPKKPGLKFLAALKHYITHIDMLAHNSKRAIGVDEDVLTWFRRRYGSTANRDAKVKLAASELVKAHAQGRRCVVFATGTMFVVFTGQGLPTDAPEGDIVRLLLDYKSDVERDISHVFQAKSRRGATGLGRGGQAPRRT